VRDEYIRRYVRNRNRKQVIITLDKLLGTLSAYVFWLFGSEEGTYVRPKIEIGMHAAALVHARAQACSQYPAGLVSA
jgi:hypothetical protein